MKRILWALGLFVSFNVIAAPTQIQVQVTDFEGQPAPQISIMAGQKVDTPFAGNIAATDSQGRVLFTAEPFQNLPITLVAPGHPKITYFGQTGTSFKLRLPPANPTGKQEVKGQFSKWPNKPANNAQFGIFYPALRVDRIFSFNVSDFVSTTTDTISVMGQSAEVPSNLAIPRQTVNYGFFSATVDKPIYRMPVGVPGKYSFHGVAGDFPVEPVVDKLRGGKTFFDVINDLNLTHFGYLRDVPVASSVSGLNITQDKGELKPCLTVSSSQAPQGLEVVSVGFVRDEASQDRSYQITDLKKVGSAPVTLRCVSQDQRPVTALNIGVSYHKEGNAIAFDSKMSSILVRNVPRSKAGSQVNAANFFDVPQVDVANSGMNLAVTKPSTTRGAPNAQAFYGVLADVTRTDMGQFIAEDVTPKWIVFAPESVTQIELPALPPSLRVLDFDHIITTGRARPAQTVQRWDVQWLGLDPSFQFDSTRIVSVDLGYDLFETMTHASRNAKDF